MSLTQDQATRLDEAISNLNKSVEINNQILEMLRSLGNTGVVDIATHNTDQGAHSGGFDDLVANDFIQVGTRDFETQYEDNYAQSIRLTHVNKNYKSASVAYFNSSIDSTDNSYYSGIVARLRLSEQFSSSSVSRHLFRINVSHYDTEKSSYVIISGMFFGYGSLKHNFYYSLFIHDRNTDEAMSYNFWPDAILSSKSVDIGSSANQFKDCYLTNSPIVSSDERLKQNIEEVPEAVFKAWARVSFKQYRFKEAVVSKGDNARKHVGLIAQHILAAFEAEGLDATDYGIVCHDSWDDQYEYETVTDQEAVLNEKGNVVTPEKSHQVKRLIKEAGDVWTVRYEEALALETAYQRWRLGKIEAALEAKGITL